MKSHVLDFRASPLLLGLLACAACAACGITSSPPPPAPAAGEVRVYTATDGQTCAGGSQDRNRDCERRVLVASAAHDLGCPADQIRTAPLPSRLHKGEGCGHRAVYVFDGDAPVLIGLVPALVVSPPPTHS